MAVICADSCGKSTSRRLQAEAVPAESVHKKSANKVGDFVDTLKATKHKSSLVALNYNISLEETFYRR